MTAWRRIWDPRAVRCRTSGVRAQWITPTLSGTRTTRCRTPVVRAQRNHLGSGTRAPGNSVTTKTRAFVWMNSLHMKMTGGTVEIFNRVPTTLAIPYRSRASHQARKSRHLMGQILPSSGRGLYNLRPSRAIRAGQQENG